MTRKGRWDFANRTCRNCEHCDPERSEDFVARKMDDGKDLVLKRYGCKVNHTGWTMAFDASGKDCDGSCGSWACPLGHRAENAYKAEELGSGIEKEFKRWTQIIFRGAGDPFWPDGVNANLVRNHILYYRSECRSLLLPADYPPEYEKIEVPPEVPPDFKAGRDDPPEGFSFQIREELPLGQLSIFDLGMVN